MRTGFWLGTGMIELKTSYTSKWERNILKSHVGAESNRDEAQPNPLAMQILWDAAVRRCGVALAQLTIKLSLKNNLSV